MLKKIFSIGTLTMAAIAVHAAPAGGAESDVPTVVWWQLANFIVFLILLYFLLRKRIPAFFASKKDAFLDHERKARLLKEEALKAKQLVEADLKNLVEGREDGLERARQEAALYAERMKKEAQAVTVRLNEELVRTEKIEMEKVSYSVRSQLIERSVEKARETIKKDILEDDDRRLQSEFVEKIQVVSS